MRFPRRDFYRIVFLALLLPACTPTGSYDRSARARMDAAIANEPLGDYFIGRRYFKDDYKFWGYVRRPRQPWREAKLVMLNEQRRLAPDREAWRIGSDNNVEYKLYGRFTGDTVYEPASNGFYPEFELWDYEVVSADPGPIFRSPTATSPSRRVIEQPF